MSHDQATQLRARARRLRHLARTIDTTPAMQLEGLADDATWRGQRPSLCVGLLQRNLAQLHAAADDLRWQAHLLDARAAACDAALPGQ